MHDSQQRFLEPPTRLGRASLTAALLLALLPPCVWGQSTGPTEYQVKAAYLYNFSRFVEWPNSTFEKSESAFVIGVLGEDPFGTMLDSLVQGESVQGRRLVIRRLASREEAVKCQILFVSDSEEGRLSEILKELAGKSILTVSDIRSFTRLGGAIRFTVEGNRVRFEINVAAAQRARLSVSSQLLKLARIVESSKREGSE